MSIELERERINADKEQLRLEEELAKAHTETDCVAQQLQHFEREENA